MPAHDAITAFLTLILFLLDSALSREAKDLHAVLLDMLGLRTHSQADSHVKACACNT